MDTAQGQKPKYKKKSLQFVDSAERYSSRLIKYRKGMAILPLWKSLKSLAGGNASKGRLTITLTLEPVVDKPITPGDKYDVLVTTVYLRFYL